ncbi:MULTISPECIES: SHOCT domain-containing protein [Bizionia]|uniref:SHOCT domain-containing protein n=1 Tax=Bizionia algoritergicola TaxID=291187 RepID=A0A5D0QM71_9FLAO|nr:MULTISPECIES: SHOCT domain-containing protein [Bizionia]OBX18064.1 hypothetical protein BAA08_15630 [Bizionia sp. APA-3]TYB70015.1 hypothetical protein ES675_16020 [Bizionia algoritergicola]
MDERILIGAIVGLGTVSSIYIWKSENFSKAQKTILLVCILFLPLQWVLAIIMHFYNKKSDFIIGYKQNNNIKSIDKLKQLKDAEILSEEEYEDKIKTIENENKLYDVKKTNEYKSLINLNKQGILSNDEFDEKVELLKLNTNNLKYKAKPIVSTIKPRDLIGIWANKNETFEFWLTGFFIHKIDNRKITSGSWLYKNGGYLMKLKDSSQIIILIEIKNQKLKIKINSNEVICTKIKNEI